MKELIEQLISLLDEREDFFLIGLLKNKTENVKLTQAKLSKSEIYAARSGIRRIIRKELLPHGKLDQIERIIDSRCCSTCKFSKRKLGKSTHIVERQTLGP